MAPRRARARGRQDGGADLNNAQHPQHLSTPANLHERVASIDEMDVRSDPDLALRNNRDEEQLAAIRAEILALRIKNRRKNTADTYKAGQRLWKVILSPNCFNGVFLTNLYFTGVVQTARLGGWRSYS
jgi:hypothetical protein